LETVGSEKWGIPIRRRVVVSICCVHSNKRSIMPTPIGVRGDVLISVRAPLSILVTAVASTVVLKKYPKHLILQEILNRIN